MSGDILGTSWDQCRSMVQYSFTSTETRRLVRDGQPRTATSTLTQLLNYGRGGPSAQVLTLQIIRAIKLPANQKRERTTGEKKRLNGHGPEHTHYTPLYIKKIFRSVNTSSWQVWGEQGQTFRRYGTIWDVGGIATVIATVFSSYCLFTWFS